MQKKLLLDQLARQYKNCQACPLARLGCSRVVFGVGNAQAQLMFIGEAPGKDEDLQGEPFVGRAGRLLTKMIIDIGLSRADVYITNVVKCRPPGNRTPKPEERETCKNLILVKEIKIIQPKIICTLGSQATKALLGDDVQISDVRGKFSYYEGIPVMPTYHPAYLLRSPTKKYIVQEDMKIILEALLIK